MFYFTSVIGSVLFALFLILLFYALTAAGFLFIFVKAGQPYWTALIPFYNTYTQYKISWDTFWFWVYIGGLILSFLLRGHGWFFNGLASLTTLASTAASGVVAFKLAKAFGKSFAFAVGLFFLGPVFMLILGLGNARYYGPQ